MNKYFYTATVIYEEVEKRHRIVNIIENRWRMEDMGQHLTPIFRCEQLGNCLEFAYSINAEDLRQALEILETVINI